MDKYFDDNLEFGASTKEIMEISSGVLIHEVPELSKMSGREVETVKAMMSRQKDKARLAYGRSTSEMPRQFILWGTSNDRKYLKDPTGSVRFWPVWSTATLAKPIDTDGLSKVVRLLWGKQPTVSGKGRVATSRVRRCGSPRSLKASGYDGGDIHDAITDAVEGKEGFIVGHALLGVCDLSGRAAAQHHRREGHQECHDQEWLAAGQTLSQPQRQGGARTWMVQRRHSRRRSCGILLGQ